MEMNCDTCGFRSSTLGFFRRAKGGLLDRMKTVCEGCDPYQPCLYERKLFRNVFVLQILWLVMIAWASLGLVKDTLALFLMVEGALLTTAIRIAIHEAGHAAAAAALGAHVTRVTVGHGPIARRFRWRGVRVDLRRYTFIGGLTEMRWPTEPPPRWRLILVFLAGPGANAVFAVLAFWAANHLQLGWVAVTLRSLLSGFGVSQAATAVFNLWPSTSRLNRLPSDGRQILAWLFRPPRPDAAMQALLRGRRHLEAGEMKLAAVAFWQAAELKPDATYAFAMTIHCLSQADGDAASLAFFRLHRLAFEASMKTTDKAHSGAVPYLQANIAMSAIDSDLPLADGYSQIALAAQPQAPGLLGARGTYLAASGDPAAGRELLMRAIRGTTGGADRATFAKVLAQLDRAAGDAASGEAFENLAWFARAA